MTRWMLLTALLAAAALPAAAGASTVRWGLTPAGDPQLALDPASGFDTGAWWTCPPGDVCRLVSMGATFAPGESARGTVFELDSDPVPRETARSPMWNGRVTATLPPALEGAATPGGTVRPTPAAWAGGWGDEVSARAVLVCPSLTRTDCERVTGPLQDKHRGWYLYAVETRGTPDAPPAPAAGARPVPSALVSVSAPAGPVADDPPRADVILRKRASRSGRRLTVGRVRCERCRVELRVGSARRTFSVREAGSLTVAARGLPRAARARVTVTIAGLRLVSRTIGT